VTRALSTIHVHLRSTIRGLMTPQDWVPPHTPRAPLIIGSVSHIPAQWGPKRGPRVGTEPTQKSQARHFHGEKLAKRSKYHEGNP
jgi:hypothetical protein